MQEKARSNDDLKAAVAKYEEALKIYQRVGDAKNSGVVYSSLGTVYWGWGQYQKALEYYEKSLDIARRSGDAKTEGAVLMFLGIVYKDWGQYQKAKEYYEKGLEIFRKIGDVKAEGQTLTALGLIYADWGQFQKAVAYYEKGLEIARKIGDVNSEGRSLNNLGVVYSTLGESEKAQAYFEKGLAIAQKIGVPDDRPKNLLAGLFMDQGALDKAEPWIKQAGYNTTWGRYFLLKSDYKKAEEQYAKLLKSAEKSGNAANLFAAYTGLGKAYEGLQDYEKARDFYTKGMELVEEMRSSLTAGERANFYDVKIEGFSRVEPARGLTRVNMKLNQAAETIASSETTRARAFSDRISLRSEAGDSGVPLKVRHEGGRLVAQVAGLKQSRGKIDRAKNPEGYDNISKDLEKAERDLNAFVEQLWKDYKAYAAVKFPRPVELKDSAVRPDEHLLVFDVVGQGVAVKLIKGKEILESRFLKWEQKDMEADVKKFREPFEKFDLRAFDVDLAKTLYSKLLASALHQVAEGTHLTIIPDGILASIPFEMLVMEGQPTWKKGERGPYPEGLKYVGDLYPISYTQSITALTRAHPGPEDQAREQAPCHGRPGIRRG